MTLEEALTGKEIPVEIRKELLLVDVPYFSFDGEVKIGQLIVHQDLGREVKAIFKKLLEMKFPIERMVPVVEYGWDDEVSMAANNTSAFNYRLNYSNPNKMSRHAFGRAIDINPVLNPFVKEEIIAPQGAAYDPNISGTITEKIAKLFEKEGWIWGGRWTDQKDWQHFEKS